MTSFRKPVSNYFISVCQDWTSNLTAQNAKVLFCPYSPDADVSQLCTTVLSDHEMKKSQNFISPELTSAFIQRRAYRRYCAAIALEKPDSLLDQNFEETTKGRPYLPHASDTCFSFSSCSSGFVGAWSNSHSLGIDIEDIGREVEALELAQQFFTPFEFNLVEDEANDEEAKRVFFQLWCLKEAALKSIGEGLPFGMDKFQFELEPAARVKVPPNNHTVNRKFESYLFNRAAFVAALITHS